MSGNGMGAQSGHTRVGLPQQEQRGLSHVAGRRIRTRTTSTKGTCRERLQRPASNEARPQKSSRQKFPMTLCIAGARECRQALREYHSERKLFSHLFFSMLCFRLSKNCSAFFCLLVRSLPLSLPPPLSLSFDIAAIDVSNWACCFASSFAACEAFKASLSASAPSLARLFASWLFWFRWFCCLEKPVWCSLVLAASRHEV